MDGHTTVELRDEENVAGWREGQPGGECRGDRCRNDVGRRIDDGDIRRRRAARAEQACAVSREEAIAHHGGHRELADLPQRPCVEHPDDGALWKRRGERRQPGQHGVEPAARGIDEDRPDREPAPHDAAPDVNRRADLIERGIDDRNQPARARQGLQRVGTRIVQSGTDIGQLLSGCRGGTRQHEGHGHNDQETAPVSARLHSIHRCLRSAILACCCHPTSRRRGSNEHGALLAPGAPAVGHRSPAGGSWFNAARNGIKRRRYPSASPKSMKWRYWRCGP